MSITTVFKYVSAGLLALGLATLTPRAQADAWNQKTIITFSGPVEIPGQVLPPGTYVFKLMDSQSDRNIVEVFNKNQDHVYGTFLAIPDYRLKPSGKPIITFEERAAGAPEAVKAWFYPGDNYGHEFVYPKVRALELAKTNNQPVPAMPNELAANTTKPVKTMKEQSVMAMKQAPLKAEQPSQQEVEIAEVFTPPPAPPAPAAKPARLPKRLPKTGSSLPLIGLLGLMSLGAAGALRFLAAKMR
jgi:LPXTG-motif cell wall-anchored protein